MLIGHKQIFERLKSEADAGVLHPAQIFLGPRQIGKSKVALLLATHMQCPDESNVVLRKQIAEGADADTLIFADDGEILPITTARAIVARAAQSHARPNLIFIIENIGRMLIDSMNTLLKVLEEPGEGVFFFLTAENDDDIIPTIRSRSKISNFYPVPDADMLSACAENPYREELVRFAMGRPGKLMRLTEDPEYLNSHREMYSIVNKFFESPSLPYVFEMERKFEDKKLLADFLDILLIRSRAVLLSGERGGALEHLDFTDMIPAIEKAKSDIIAYVNPKLVIENLLIPFVP